MKTSEPTANRIIEYLEQGKRFDGRKLEDFREIIIEKDVSKKAEGSVRVKLGNTEVLVGVKLGVSEPYADSPTKGNLMVTAETLPLSSVRYESGPPRIEAIEWARVTDRGLRESGFIDFDKLSIIDGEKVWTVFVDIYSINADGNLMDAAMIGAIAALKIARLPKFDKETGKAVFELTDKGLPLTNNVPYTVSVHKLGNSLIVDPTLEEEDLSEARVTIGSYEGIISSVQKSNSAALTIEEMKKVFELGEKISKDLKVKIEKLLK
ncbi:MAG: exosome complex protein Rrp42 [Nanoarchaeota archaeon]|nr:exosome complex protein Rrp42 [Nanoarchaeota archaeon]